MIAIMSLTEKDLFEDLASQKRQFEPGQYLFHRGDPVQRLFRVVAGEVQLVRPQKAGDVIVLQRASPGEVVAEASVFAGHYHCDGIANTEATVLSVSRDAFLTHFRQNPEFAEVWAARLARKVQLMRLQNEILSLKTVRERLRAWQAWHGGLPPKGEWIHIARQIGVSPEALYREIGKQRG